MLGYLLWRLHLRAILPADIIRGVPIRENNEPVVAVTPTTRLSTDGDQRLRQSVAAALYRAAELLPTAYRLHLIQSYRSPQQQLQKWQDKYAQMRHEHPHATEEQLRGLTRRFVADPSAAGIPAHQTAAAVDVTLTDETGTFWDMGTAPLQANRHTATAHAPDRPSRERRRILYHAMARAGFANYPGEWWHFSMGDQLFAAYKKRPFARFGRVAP